MKNLSDEKLVEIYKKGGSQEAFEILLERYKLPLYSYIIKMISDRAEAEDLFQEVFIKVIKGLPCYQSRDKFKSWIFKIARNMTIDYLRKNKNKKTCSIDEKIQVEKSKDFTIKDLLPSKDYGPEKILEKKELKENLIKSLEELTTEQKEVFLLRHDLGFSFKEITELLNCPLNTALGRMHQAIKKIRKSLCLTDSYEL